MKIITNRFTRQFCVLDDENNIVKLSKTEMNLDNISKYLQYVNSIDSMSVVYYNLTKRCNFNCSYCYSVHENTAVTLSDNRIILEKLKMLHTKSVALIGGEPLCHPNFHDILKSCIDAEFLEEICVVTNGSLIDDTHMDMYCNPRVTIQISLDGIDEETNLPTRGRNHFLQVYHNIIKLRDAGAKVIVMKVITHGNIDDSKKFYKFYREKNIAVGFLMVKQVRDTDKPSIMQIESLLDFIYEMENHDVEKVFRIVNFADNMMMDKVGFPIMHCGAGINAISIMPTGEVSACVKMEKIGKFITNILNESALEDIRKNRKHIINSELVYLKKPCAECDIAFYCGGGCRAEESTNNQICEYNCQYFHFAKVYFLKKILSEYEK